METAQIPKIDEDTTFPSPSALQLGWECLRRKYIVPHAKKYQYFVENTNAFHVMNAST